MDPCRVGANLANSRSMIRTSLGVPREYANKMSANGICTAFKNCQQTNILPPMDFRTKGTKSYLIDPRSPISLSDYLVLFGKGDLKRVAKKVGLIHVGLSRTVVKAGIIDMLKSLNICEPVELPTKRTPKSPNVNMNGNMNTGSGNRNLMNTGNGNRNLMNNGSMNNGDSFNKKPFNNGSSSNNSFNKKPFNNGSSSEPNWSPNGMPPINRKEFKIHPRGFKQTKTIDNSKIKNLIRRYRRNGNNRYLRNFGRTYNSDNSEEEIELLKKLIKNDTKNNNSKLFEIKKRITLPKPKPNTKPTDGPPTASQINNLTKKAQEISEQIGRPPITEEPAAPF